MKKISLMLFFLVASLILFACGKNTKYVLNDEEIKVSASAKIKETLFTLQYEEQEIPSSMKYVKLSLSKKSELASLYDEYLTINKKHNNDLASLVTKIRTIIGNNKLLTGKYQGIAHLITFDEAIKDKIIAKDFKYIPGEISLAKSGEPINFIYDASPKRDYEGLNLTRITKLFNDETKSYEYSETKEFVPKVQGDNYSIIVKEDLNYSVKEFKTDQQFLITYSTDIYKNKLLKHLKLEVLDGTKWAALELSQNTQTLLAINTKVRITIKDIPEKVFIKLALNAVALELDQNMQVETKIRNNSEISLALPEKITYKINSDKIQEGKHNSTVEEISPLEFAIVKNSIVKYEFELATHYELVNVNIKDSEGKDITITKKQELDVDPLKKANTRKYYIEYPAQKDGVINIELKKILQTITRENIDSDGYEKGIDFINNYKEYIKSMNVENLDQVESGTKVEIEFKKLPQGKTHFMHSNELGILEIVNNKATFIVNGPLTIRYGQKLAG